MNVFFRSILVTTVLLASAGFVATRLFSRPEHPPVKTPEECIKEVVPHANALLAHRMAEKWGWNAVEAAKVAGDAGLLALEAFEDEADYCLHHDLRAFQSLARTVRLDPGRFRLATGPWNRAVLDWAQNGKLDRFLDRLETLPSDRLSVAEGNPSALPLLCVHDAPIAHAMLERYGDRAWRLFMAVNFHDYPEDLERVAESVVREGEMLLSLNEDFGLPFALLLVSPETELGSQRTPDVVRHALRTMDDRALALSLIIVNLEDIHDLLDNGKSVDDLAEAIDLYRSLPPVVQEIAADHAHVLRLLTETWGGRKPGAEVLEKCGPHAADLIYTYYASDDRLKWPALVSLAKSGRTAYDVLDRYKGYGRFHALLRRAEPEGLLDVRDGAPLVAHVIQEIGRKGQGQIDVYASVENLKGQIERDLRGPLPKEAWLEWIPGYIAYRTISDWKSGYHVTGGDVFWGSVDAALTATAVYGLAANAAKGVTQKALQQGAKGLSREAIGQLEKQIAQKLEGIGTKILGHDLSRFGPKAEEVAAKRLMARRSDGINLRLASREVEFRGLSQAGAVNGKARLIEEIGDEGAKKYADAVGYKTLYQGKPGKGQGFDHVYRDGDTIVVVEAKGSGGTSPELRPYRGHVQGTHEYTREVAEWASHHSTDPSEKAVAGDVLRAYQGDRVRVEVVHTQHVQGKPLRTRVYRETLPRDAITIAADRLQNVLLQTPGMAVAWVRSAGHDAGQVSLKARLSRGRGVARKVGVALWDEGSGPLLPRTVRRRGVAQTIAVEELPISASSRSVDDFAAALMERGM